MFVLGKGTVVLGLGGQGGRPVLVLVVAFFVLCAPNPQSRVLYGV